MTDALSRSLRELAISIHIPRVGDDVVMSPTVAEIRQISIHIPRVGDDQPYEYGHPYTKNFNPHPPCGG